ncbi:MAG: ribosome biogenesis GTP-binding protein YihA/YsxC [Clostridia bacterium]
MIIKTAKYITSVVKKEDLGKFSMPEIAFVGRSNVGKSSLLNKLCQSKNLAKTSQTPGRTRMINYFCINDEVMFVDLPGYGFAKAGKDNKELWATLMEDYLTLSENLKLVYLLVDIRHIPTELDKQMQFFLFANQIPFKIIATKSDKIAKTKINQYIQQVATYLSVGKDDVIDFSSESGRNAKKVLDVIDEVLLTI